jgi:hypothetical protein
MLSRMIRSFKTKTVAIAAVGVLSLGGVAFAATNAANAPTPLTGSVTDKASEAVVAKYPGSTLVGIESRPDGTFEARVRKSDGTQVGVTLDKDFKITSTREGGPGRGGPGGFGGHGGPGGHRGFLDTAALAKALGVTEAKLQAAIEKVRPERGDRKDERVAAIAKALDASASDVQAVLEAQRGAGGPGRGGPGAGGPGRGGPRGDDSALVTALAKKTGKTEAQVRAALDAARPKPGDRFDELSAALAKELGLDAAKVESALEAAKPAGRGPGAGQP